MNIAIQWSPRAVLNLEKHLDYLQKEWGQKVVKKVLGRIEEILTAIAHNPEIYPVLDSDRKIHRCVVTSQIVLYYRRKEQIIELVTFWDARQNPENLNL